MAFAVALSKKKRLKMIDHLGVEQHEEKDPLDASYLQLIAEQEQPEQEADAKDGEEEEAAPSPWEAIEKFHVARGELDVILDLVRNLAGQPYPYLDYRMLTAASKGRGDAAKQVQDKAMASMVRCARRATALSDVAARLRLGASALRGVVAADNAFYRDLHALQRFWRLRLTPPAQQAVDGLFTVDIGLDVVGAEERGGAEGGGGPSLPLSLPLIKEPGTGALRLLLDLAPERAARLPGFPKLGGPHVQYQKGGHIQVVGWRTAHLALLALQRGLAWRHISALLDSEALAGAAANNFVFSLAKKVIQELTQHPASPAVVAIHRGTNNQLGGRGSSSAAAAAMLHGSSSSSMDARLAALRPLVLEHLAWCLMPSSAALPITPRPYVTAPPAMALLPQLQAWLAHTFFWGHLLAQLDAQAHALASQQPPPPGPVLLHWTPTTRPCCSALRISVAPDTLRCHDLLLSVRDGVTSELEGVANPHGPLTRWAREGQVSCPRQEVPRILTSLVQQAVAGCSYGGSSSNSNWQQQ